MPKIRKYFRDPNSLKLNKFLFTPDSFSSPTVFTKESLKLKGNIINNDDYHFRVRTTFKSYSRQTLEDAITIFRKFKYQLQEDMAIHGKQNQKNDTNSYAIQTIIDQSGEASLPTKIRRYCVLTSPHVNSDAREHFEIRVHKSIIDTFDPPNCFFPIFKKIVFPPGVDITVKHQTLSPRNREFDYYDKKSKKTRIKRERKGRLRISGFLFI